MRRKKGNGTDRNRGGATARLQYFLIISTCFLYLVAAGLFSRAVWFFEAQKWNNAVGGDAAETGAGPGSYDIDKSVWHVNVSLSSTPSTTPPFLLFLGKHGYRALTPLQFGNPELNGGGGWGIFNAVFGWQNSATFGSVISYNVYWIFVMGMFASMRFQEVRGRWPWGRKVKAGEREEDVEGSSAREGGGEGSERDEKRVGVVDLRTVGVVGG